ncbi:MAG: coiled coil domain-containing protein [Polyangia bacterium]
MENTPAHVGKMEEQLKHWGAKLDHLVAKVEKAGSDVNSERRKRVDDLKAKYQAAQAKLSEVKAAGGEKWATLKGGVESAWSELEAAFRKMKN